MEDLIQKTDEEIAAMVQKGNVDAFGVLVERYQDKLSRYAAKFLLFRDDAADIVQEVFIKAYTNIQSFDLNRRFSPWVYRIAHNEFVNAIKKKSGKETVSLFDYDIFFPHPLAKETADAELSRKEVKEILDASLAKLDPKYREPVVLYYLEDLNYQEISDILKIPVSTVGVRLIRAKSMLKKIIQSQNFK